MLDVQVFNAKGQRVGPFVSSVGLSWSATEIQELAERGRDVVVLNRHGNPHYAQGALRRCTLEDSPEALAMGRFFDERDRPTQQREPRPLR